VGCFFSTCQAIAIFQPLHVSILYHDFSASGNLFASVGNSQAAFRAIGE
jgi:hypothetical protein